MLIVSAIALAATLISTAAADPPKAVAPGVALIPGAFPAGTQPDGNSVVFRSKHGLLVFDTGRHASHTQKIVDYATSLRLPVTTIVNSHWHLDHIGGNALLRREFPNVRVYASGALNEARRNFLAKYREQLETVMPQTSNPAAREAYTTELHLIDNAAALEPDVVVTATQRLDFGGRTIELHLENRAVTGGDLWLYDATDRLAVSGDLVTLPVPFLDTACPTGWSAALDHISQTAFRTLIPGHGAPMSRAGFETWRKAYGNLLTCAASSATKDACIDGWVRDAAPLVKGENAERMRSMLDYYVAGVLRGQPENIRQLCGQ
jgi:glyoxylase-like metal-dependent hydrolase (beta-lactamase superfamily II)